METFKEAEADEPAAEFDGSLVEDYEDDLKAILGAIDGAAVEDNVNLEDCKL